MTDDTRMRILDDPGPNATLARRGDSGPLAPYGMRGRLRLLRILWAGFKIRSVLWLHKKGWFTGGLDDAALRRREGARLRAELVALGPTFVKIGQTLSTRVDLLPLEYVEELRELQDRVPPFPNSEALAIIERELGRSPSDVFESIGTDPIAAASLGQVYRARIREGAAAGADVVIKVQRPDLERVVELDLAALRHLAPRLVESGELKNVDWWGVMDEFEHVIREEMDYTKEIANAETFRGNFAKWPEIFVPRMFPELSTARVLTMTYVPGVKVNDHAGLKRMGLTPIGIVELLVRSYLKQLLEDGFFHADPHPGNLRVMPDGRLAFFDFGMVGRISLDLQSQLVDAYLHIVEKDWPALLLDAVDLGFLRIDRENQEELDRVLGELLGRYEGYKLTSTPIQELNTDVASVLYNYPFQIPAHFTFILRAITTIDGIGLEADPDFNFFTMARPYAKEFMLRREGRYMGGKLLSRMLRKEEGGKIDWQKAWKLAKLTWKHLVTKK